MQINTFSEQGIFHKSSRIPNQDAVLAIQAGGFAGAVLCDGVSLTTKRTLSQSEIASKICTRTVRSFLENELERGLSDRRIMILLNQAFMYANEVLNRTLRKLKIDIYDCQTTMIVFLLRKGKLYAGIAGDGGILYQEADGTIGAMVTRWKTSSGVYPLGDPSHWRFFACDHPLSRVRQVIAATDGVFDLLAAKQNDQIVIDFGRLKDLFFLSSLKEGQRQKQLESLIRDFPTKDDKTIAIITDGSIRKNRTYMR